MSNYPNNVHEFIDLNSKKYTPGPSLILGLFKLIFLPFTLPLKVLILLVTNKYYFYDFKKNYN